MINFAHRGASEYAPENAARVQASKIIYLALFEN